MLNKSAIQELEKQQYRIIGNHSAVKICGWTRSMIKGEGSCYKLTFYGIQSHQCMQMTTNISCANRCIFCWRGYKSPISKDWKSEADDPKTIINQSIKAHHKLLIGLKGNEKAQKNLYYASNKVKHIALSLTGEPIIYPKINELIDECNKQGISTFLVTNAQYPEHIKNLNPVTQLYISLDAPTKQLLKKIDIPLFKDYWGRLNKSLEFMAKKKQRTCIRLSCIKGMNMIEPEKYAELIKKADPDFIELKGYMFIGASRQRLNKEDMPYHEDVVEFSRKLNKFLPGYGIVAEHISSRAVLLAKKKFKINNKWHTWIDFKDNRKVKLTPKIGISGKGTLDRSKHKNMIF